MSSPIHQLLNTFSRLNVSPVDLIITLLQDDVYQSYDTTRDIVESVPKLINVFLEQASTKDMAIKAVLRFSMERYTTELMALTHPNAGFHFAATKTTETRLDGTQLTEMATEMGTIAPSLWNLLDNLLSADHAIEYQRQWKRKKATAAAKRHNSKLEDEDITMQDVSVTENKHAEAVSSVDERDKMLFSIVNVLSYTFTVDK